MAHSSTGMDQFMSAAAGVDIITGTAANTPAAGVHWKGFVVLIEATLTVFTDDGDTPSTVLPVGSVVTAQGHITTFTMSGGTVEMIRG